MNKIKKDDLVIVLAGNAKGERGRVLRVLMNSVRQPEYVLVEGVNMATHFERPNPQKNTQGGLVKHEAKIHISNVAVCDESSGRAMRSKIVRGKDGKKAREFVLSKRQSAAAAAVAKPSAKKPKAAKKATAADKTSKTSHADKADKPESADSAGAGKTAEGSDS